MQYLFGALDDDRDDDGAARHAASIARSIVYWNDDRTSRGSEVALHPLVRALSGSLVIEPEREPGPRIAALVAPRRLRQIEGVPASVGTALMKALAGRWRRDDGTIVRVS